MGKTRGRPETAFIQKEQTMKESTKDQVAGTLHQLKGKVKEVAGIVSDKPKLEGEGTGEKIAGQVQVKIGQFNKFIGK